MKRKRGVSFLIGLIAIAAYVLMWPREAQSVESLSAAGLEKVLSDSGKVSKVEIRPAQQGTTAGVTVRLKDGSAGRATVPELTEFTARLEKKGIDYNLQEPERSGRLSDWGVPLMTFGLLAVFIFVMNRRASGMNGFNQRMESFTKNKARLSRETKVTFGDVAGMQEEKGELKEVVDFLKTPEKYRSCGARIPKGLILVGPPGTGKTLLAKAVAGEAGVPFFSISGSDFVEMYVGVGAARVRDMFEDAKKNSPCIVFIDEIDAVARRRGTGLGGSHDEREQTLNQLLVEMDGFAENQGIIVFAATNRVDILDPAIMRPGRFDRKITVSRPDITARLEILKVHARNKHLSEEVDLETVARTTAGYTGADLENMLNEAAIHCASAGREAITASDLEDAFIRTGIGREKRSRIISERDKRITAYHEAGHAILFHELKDVGPVHLISIIPTGEGAAGYTMPLPDKEDMHVTKGQLRHRIMAAMGGRIAEELVLEDITCGASQDIKQVTAIARAMITNYGMSDRIGMISCGNEEENVFLGYELGHNVTYGDSLLSRIDEEVKRIVDECYAEAKEIIQRNRAVLEKSCELLLEKERLTGEEFDALFH